MQKSRNTNLLHFLRGKSPVFRNNHSHGSNIHTVLEGVFIADFQSTDIDCQSIILFQCFHKLTGNIVGCIHEAWRVRITVKELDSFRNSFLHTFMQFNLRTVGNLHLLDLLHNFRRNVIGDFLIAFFAFADINSTNAHLAKGINHVIVKSCLPVNQDTSGSIDDGLVNDHAGS